MARICLVQLHCPEAKLSLSQRDTRILAGDDRLTAATGAPRARLERLGPLEQEALLDELVEALTALGIWLTAADRKVHNAWLFRHDEFFEILTTATGQYRRAAIALRRLRGANRRADSPSIRGADETLRREAG